MGLTLAQTGRTAVGLPVQGGGPRRTRLYLEGVEAPVITRVRRRTSDRLTVSQALPFLALQNQVYDEGMRLGRISSVDLSLDGDTPELVIELVYDAPVRASDSAHDTVPGIVEAPVVAPSRRDPTLSFERERREVRCELLVGSAVRADEPTILFKTGVGPDETSAPRAGLLPRLGERAARAFRVAREFRPSVPWRRHLLPALRALGQQVVAAILRRASRLLAPRLP